MTRGHIEHVEAAFGCGVVGPVGVLLWRGEPTRDCLERAAAAFHRAVRDAGPSFGMLAVWEPGSPPPSLAELPGLARRFDALEGLRATVGIVEDRGPLARVLVEVASTIFALRRDRGQPLKICADATEGAAWMARRFDDPALTPEMLSLVERIRASIP